MGRIIAIDYGLKRVGLAESDPNHVFAFGLPTQERKNVFTFIKHLSSSYQIDSFVIGKSLTMNNQPSEIYYQVLEFSKKLSSLFPDIPISFYDERMTSKVASQTLYLTKAKAKTKKKKALKDQISAILILQEYLIRKEFELTKT